MRNLPILMILAPFAIGCPGGGEDCPEGQELNADDVCVDIATDDDEVCDDGVDNDDDGDIDCDDRDCDGETACALTFSGTLDYTSSFTGTDETGDITGPGCDVTIDLAAEQYSGSCNDCDWTFLVTPTVSSDDSTGPCDLDNIYAFGPYVYETYEYDALVSFWSSYATDYETYTNVFALGFDVGYAYPAAFLDFDGSESTTSSASVDGGDVSWDFEVDLGGSENAYINGDCDPGPEESDASSAATGAALSEDLACGEAEVVDVWSFDATPGTPVSISVDTVDAATTFDSWLILNGPDECTLEFGDDNFDCTFPPPNYSCPAIAGFDPPTAGTYQAVVVSWTDCADPSGQGNYEITFAGADAEPTLTGDDVTRWAWSYSETVVGSGTGTVASVE